MSARARPYSRVPQSDVASAMSYHGNEGHTGSLDDDDDDVSLLNDEMANHDDGEEDTLKKKRSQRSHQAAIWSTKIHALLWILSAGIVAYALDFFHVIFNDPRIHKTYFHIALICMGINICITMYLAIWLPYVKKIHLEWSVYCPRMIPTATIVGLIATFCFIIAFWPVWGLLTPCILMLFFLGSLMTAHFLPSI